MNIKDFKVGQKVYVKKMGNAASHVNSENLISEETVSKVGNKYIYLDGFERSKFGYHFRSELVDISDYSPQYQIYRSKQEIEDEITITNLSEEIRVIFQGYGACKNYTIDQLRRIIAITKEIE